MYTIVCDYGHERRDPKPRGVCTVCGNLMRLKPKPVYKPKKEEKIDG